MSDRSSNFGQSDHDAGPCQNKDVSLFKNRLTDSPIQRSASMDHLSYVTESNISGSPDEKSDHQFGYVSEDLESGYQERKGRLRTKEADISSTQGLQGSYAQEPLSPREDDVTTEEELNARVEALIKKFYSQTQRRKPVEALSAKEENMMTEEELNDRVEEFVQKFYSQMKERKPVEEPCEAPASFFNTKESPPMARWVGQRVQKRRRAAAKDDTNGRTSIDILSETESDDEVQNRRDGSSTQAQNRRDGSSTRKVVLDKIFVIGNFVLELPSAVFDQLSSLHKPQYALLSMLTSFATIFICVIELVLKGRQERVKWRWRGKIPQLYYPGEDNKAFATFTDIIGLICAIFQGVFTSIGYAYYCRHTDNPVKISVWPLVFAFGLLCSKLFNKAEKKVSPRES